MTWFHLYRLVLEQPVEAEAQEEGQQQVQQVALAVEQFLQTSTVGEYERRLDMVWSFRSASLSSAQVVTSCCNAEYNIHGRMFAPSSLC